MGAATLDVLRTGILWGDLPARLGSLSSAFCIVSSRICRMTMANDARDAPIAAPLTKEEVDLLDRVLPDKTAARLGLF